MNNEYIVLTDGSSHAPSKVGYGAALLLRAGDLVQPLEKLKKQVRVKRFEQTSSTRLELQTLLWALGQFPEPPCRVIICTDSQNIVGLPSRRQRLEGLGFKSSTGKLLKKCRSLPSIISADRSLQMYFCENVRPSTCAGQRQNRPSVFSR